MPIHPLAEDFYKYLKYDKSERTAYNYSRNVSNFLWFVDKPLDQITPLDVTRWYDHLRSKAPRLHSARSIWRYGWALRCFFNIMGRPDLAKKTPIVKFEVPEPLWLPEKTTFELIGNISPLCVGYELALRIGELQYLKRSTFNPNTGEIEVKRLKHKGQRDTYILRMDNWCLEILNDYVERYGDYIGDRIFPMGTATVGRTFRARANSLGLSQKYTFHCLRHSRITHIAIRQLEEKGVVDELSLAKFAGHLRLETTRLYVHLASKYLAFKGRENIGKES